MIKLQELDFSGSFVGFNISIWGGDAPTKEMTWFDREDHEIHDAVFNQKIEEEIY